MIKRPILEGRSPTHARNTSTRSSKRKSAQATGDRRDDEDSTDPIGYQAIVLDPNPKAVCQLLGKDTKMITAFFVYCHNIYPNKTYYERLCFFYQHWP